MGIFLASAGYFYSIHNGIMSFGCLCGAQVMLQIISAPLFIYQSEVLTNSALGMTSSLRALIFVGLKRLVTNLLDGKAPKNPPLFKCGIAELFYFFGAF